jgi:hypothetical protein
MDQAVVHSYDYGAIHRNALQVNWRVEDIIGGERVLDFRLRFLPEVWVDAEPLTFLPEADQLALNHVRAHSYLYFLGFAEEYFLPFVVDHLRGRIHKAAQDEIQALAHFAEEESKHIELFRRFSEEFHRGFGTPCEFIGPAERLAKQILSLSPLGVGLSVLQLEWMTQLHYVASVQDDRSLDPQFCSLLRHHWLEEAQHTKLDSAIAICIAQTLAPEQVAAGVEDLITINRMLDEGFGEQVELDIAAMRLATKQRLVGTEAARYRAVQRRSYRRTFLTSGLRHRGFRATLGEISPTGAAKVAEYAEALDPGP